LVNSPSKEGAFCKYCAIFGPEGAGRGSQKLHTFVVTPFSKFKDAITDMKKHAENQYHAFSLEKAGNLNRTSTEKVAPVDVQLDSQKQQTIASNRLRLTPIIKTIMLCARHNIPLRGHRDDGRLTL